MKTAEAEKIAEAYKKMDPKSKIYLTGYIDGAADQKEAEKQKKRQQAEEQEQPA